MIQIIRTSAELSDIVESWKAQNLKIGFVPTMGALHEGHLSLVKLALENADRCIVSIFVNPTQFAPHEDFSRYPRDEAGDTAKLASAGTHLVYMPAAEEIYPDGPASTIKAGKAAQGLEGDFRPTHFDGVATVVHRLFEQVRPDIAVFGEKDFQQLQVIREMVAAHNMDVEIIGAPIIRDEYGLALSSRNAYLSADELKAARRLNKILSEAINQISSLRAEGEAIQNDSDLSSGLPRRLTTSQVVRLLAMTEDAKQKLLAAGFTKVDYVEQRWGRLLAAAWIGKTRLIDNMPV